MEGSHDQSKNTVLICSSEKIVKRLEVESIASIVPLIPIEMRVVGGKEGTSKSQSITIVYAMKRPLHRKNLVFRSSGLLCIL